MFMCIYIVTWVKDSCMHYHEKYADTNNLQLDGSLLISVKDSGVGMSVENLKELFQEGKRFNILY